MPAIWLSSSGGIVTLWLQPVHARLLSIEHGRHKLINGRQHTEEADDSLTIDTLEVNGLVQGWTMECCLHVSHVVF